MLSMPNTPVPAAGEAMPRPSFNLSEIMKDAWASYNRHYAARPWIKRVFKRQDFAFYLACAWNRARRAAMSAVERKRDQIEKEIAGLQYKPARYDIGTIRRKLETELACLAA
jgi:hypothetical protein